MAYYALMVKGRWFGFFIPLIVLVFFQGAKSLAMEVTDKFAIGGVLAGAYQYQVVADAPGFDDEGQGAVPFQPVFSFRLSEKDELLAKFGFAAGNGLNDDSPFVAAPWGADLEDDVKDINGRNRDYLLTAWYKHTFQFSEKHTLALAGGIIDSTDYLDGNAYANDEYTQFMNEALINSPNGFFVSYDIGGAVEWEIADLALTGVAMSVGENDDGNSYEFYALQLRYTINWRPGKGNYRVIIDGTSKDFSNPQGTSEEYRLAMLLSFDQQLGESFGVWFRFGWQDDKAAVIFKSVYSGGIDIRGKLWRRENDNVGLGYAYGDGANLDINSGQVFEGYYRLVLTEIFAITTDVQYIKDQVENSDDPKGFIFDIRATAHF
jgi:porin